MEVVQPSPAPCPAVPSVQGSLVALVPAQSPSLARCYLESGSELSSTSFSLTYH